MITRFPLVMGLIFIFSARAFGQEATPSPSPAPKPAMSKAQSTKLIIGTERKLWEAWKKKDFKVFKTNLSADSVMIGDEGIANKSDSLKAMEGMACEVKSYDLSDIIVTYKGTQDATCGGQAVPAAVWASSAYVKRGGRWYAASHQETPAK